MAKKPSLSKMQIAGRDEMIAEMQQKKKEADLAKKKARKVKKNTQKVTQDGT